jgi:hypothetical protein
MQIKSPPGPFHHRASIFCQWLEKVVRDFFRWTDPEVNVFRKGRRAVKHRRLPADEQILDAVTLKALEKVCDHAPPSNPADANASANCAAAARAESSQPPPDFRLVRRNRFRQQHRRICGIRILMSGDHGGKSFYSHSRHKPQRA